MDRRQGIVIPQNLFELLDAIESGRDAFEAPDRSAIEWPKFNRLFKCAVQAEQDGLIEGLEVKRSKGVQTYGWPVKFKVGQVTTLGKTYLAVRRRQN